MEIKASDEITIYKINSFSKMTRFYLLQSSTANPPVKPADGSVIGSNWSKTEPSYSPGSTSTLYFVDQTVLSDGSTKYSEVSKSSSYEAARNAWEKANGALADAYNEYYLSSSATTLSGGSWATVAPEWVNGKYMWSRTVKVDGNGDKTYAPSQNGVCIAGAKGDTGSTGPVGPSGPQGEAGVGIKSTDISYQLSASETVTPTGNWLDSPPKTDIEKPYLWTRTIITYTNSTTSTSYSVSSTFDWGPTLSNLSGKIESAETSISNNAKAIETKASQTEVTELSDGIGNLKIYTDKKTTLIQDVTGWQMNWDTMISTDEAEVASHQDYITFKKGDIILGDSASDLKLKLTKDSIQFKGTSDTEVTPDSDATAWITGKTFHIDTGEIQSSLKFGGILMKPTSSGNLAIGSAAEFGSTVRIGLATGRNTTIDSNGLKVSYGSTEIAQIGYDAVKDRNGKDVDAPFYTFGLRITSEVGAYSHAEGSGVIASGNAAHAEGENTKAIGNESHAEGNNTRASSTGSHAEGSGTIASGLCSHAEGFNTNASGYESHAGGYGTIAASEYQTAIGTCNITDSENRYLFIIGNGTLTERSNAFTVSRSGDVEAAGGLHTKGSEYLDMNNTSIYGTCTDGSNSEMLRLNTNDELLIGYGQYGKESVATRLYGGNKIAFHLKNPAASWIPYYTKGDSVSVKIYRTGFITTNGKELMFFIPLSRPIVGVSAVAISSIDGLTVRQNGDYCFSKIISSSPVKPNSYSASVVGGGCGINIKATFTDTTNVKNNDACGVYASIKITFS